MATPKAEVSYVQYFIPSDGDAEEHPNVFVVRKPPKTLTLADVQGAFPLPGEYLFRAKIPFAKAHGAWGRGGGRPAPSGAPRRRPNQRTPLTHTPTPRHARTQPPPPLSAPSVAGPEQPRGARAHL